MEDTWFWLEGSLLNDVERLFAGNMLMREWRPFSSVCYNHYLKWLVVNQNLLKGKGGDCLLTDSKEKQDIRVMKNVFCDF